MGEVEVDTEPLRAPECIAGLEAKFVEFMNDNFNTPRVISELADVFKELNKVVVSDKYSLVEKTGIFKIFFKTFDSVSSVLRLFEENPRDYMSKLKDKILKERGVTVEYIEGRLKERQSAKATKDYEKADDIKNELMQKGVSIQDTSSSVGWDIIF